MRDVIPPRFVKKHQHYVPRFWLARFAGPTGRLVGLKDGVLQHQVGVGNIMSDDWIYTVFDSWWRPSDEIEDDLGVIDGDADLLFTSLHAGRGNPSNEQWKHLCTFLALAACRHVDTMMHGHERAKEMGLAIADASSYESEAAFLAEVKLRFGCDFPLGLWAALRTKGIAALLEEAEKLLDLLPYDPRLPAQLSLAAVELVANCIAVQDLLLLDAPSDSAYVLGDHPVPIRLVSRGFDVPLSSSLAFQATPAAPGSIGGVGRRCANLAEVDEINRHQVARAKSVVIGPSRALLERLC
jgi:Protein of unknown function (DUF4238)